VPAEEDEASLFDRKLKPLRLGPGVYARGTQTQITGAEILTSVSGGARCCPSCRVKRRADSPGPGPEKILVLPSMSPCAFYCCTWQGATSAQRERAGMSCTETCKR